MSRALRDKRGAPLLLGERHLLEPPPECLQWLHDSAIPIERPEPGSDLSDLEPLRAAIGDARLLTLGEATHGTREFFQLKHRLLELCARELKFTIFGLEAPYGDFRLVNDYVLGRQNDDRYPLLALALIWAWDADEVADLVRWIRDYNRNVQTDRQLEFCGWDAQWPASSVRGILEYLSLADPELGREMAERLAPLATDFGASTYKFLPWKQQDATSITS
jgi:erythromycin esterase